MERDLPWLNFFDGRDQSVGSPSTLFERKRVKEKINHSVGELVCFACLQTSEQGYKHSLEQKTQIGTNQVRCQSLFVAHAEMGKQAYAGIDPNTP